MIDDGEKRTPQPDAQVSGDRHRVANTPVILGDLDGERLPQEGIVSAVRSEGLIVRTHGPFEIGERLFIEFPRMFPPNSPRMAIIRGRVTAVHEDAGDSQLEVRLSLMPDIPVTDIASFSLTPEEAATMVEDVRNKLRETAETGTLPVAHSAHLFHEPDAFASPVQPHNRRRYLVAMAAIMLALLALLWLLLPNAPFRPVAWHITGLPGFERASPSGETEPVAPTTPSGRAGSSNTAVEPPTHPGRFVWRPGAWVYVEDQGFSPPPMEGTVPPDIGPLFSPFGWVMAALDPLLPGPSHDSSAPPALALVVSEMLEPGGHAVTSPSPDETPSGQPEMPQTPDGTNASDAAQNDTGIQSPRPAASKADPTVAPAGDPASTESALSPGTESPAQDAGSAPNQTAPLSQDPADRTHDGPSLAESSTELDSPLHEPAPEQVEIRIDKSDYTLTIHVDGEPVAEFPVGLGRHNATPEGDFAIASKVTNPDWSDRGRIVKAGDPENPLGKRWMGLGMGGRATSYGIHPTNQPESIGADMSRGCIRMRPEDAEAVFRLCPVGTLVCIEP